MGQQVSAAVGGLASVSLADTLKGEGFLTSSVIFGCPRFGTESLCRSHDGLNIYTHRINLDGDPQVSTPPASEGYFHVGREQNINGPSNVTYCADNSSEVPREPALLWAAIACAVIFVLVASLGTAAVGIHAVHMTKCQHSVASHTQSFNAFLSYFAVWGLVLLMCGLTSWNAYATATEYPQRVQELLQGAPPQAETAGNLCKKPNTGMSFLTYAGIALAAFAAGALVVEDLGLKHARFSMTVLAAVVAGALVPAFATLF